MQHLKDTFKHQGKRKILIAELVEMGIKNKDILEAFNAIPRHFFLDLAFDEQAYTNMAFKLVPGKQFLTLTLLHFKLIYWN